MSDMESRIKAIIIKHLGIKEEHKVTLDARFIEDLGADSLDLVEVIMALEEEFNAEIPDEDAEKLKTVAEAVDYIKTHAKTRKVDS